MFSATLHRTSFGAKKELDEKAYTLIPTVKDMNLTFLL